MINEELLAEAGFRNDAEELDRLHLCGVLRDKGYKLGEIMEELEKAGFKPISEGGVR